MKQRIALIGFGTVAQGLCEILIDKKNELAKKYNYHYEIVAVSDIRFGTVYNPNGLNLKKLLREINEKGKFIKDKVEWDTIQTIEKSNSNVVCELAYTNLKNGQPAIKHFEVAFKNRKHIVTSNKGPAALAYRRLKRLAEKNGVRFMIEGTVLSGTPVINLVNGPLAGNRINAIKGILNGTTNYILTRMEEGMRYEDALKEAQKLGYAEADPTNDVQGYDARAKVTILANVLMDIKLDINQVKCKGITKITQEDIKEAKRKNARWKLIGSIEKKDGRIKAYVKPELVPITHPLAGIMGSVNALTISTDLMGDITIVGKGAGKIETGFSILSDLLALNTTS